MARLHAAPFDAVVLAFEDAAQWLARVRLLRPGARPILIGADGSPEAVARAVRERAFSYFSRPFSVTAVADMVALALATVSWDDDVEAPSGLREWVTLRARCKMQTVDRLIQFLREAAGDLPSPVREDVTAAMRELVLNAVEHGGRADPQKRMTVSLLRTASAVIGQVEDPGPGFSFNEIRHAAVANPPGEPVRHVEIRAEQGVRPGGFGILLARNLVDELIYNEEGNGVMFVKYLGGGDVPGGGEPRPGRVEKI
jgi:anti-sigma regulatory factor (Ser/Thr protein kinase)